jgi:hypothetical protein
MALPPTTISKNTKTAIIAVYGWLLIPSKPFSLNMPRKTPNTRIHRPGIKPQMRLYILFIFDWWGLPSTTDMLKNLTTKSLKLFFMSFYLPPLPPNHIGELEEGRK